jgi:hypothetical protein
MSAPFRSNAAVALPARTVQNSNIVSDSNLEAASAELSKSGGSAHPVVWVIKDEQELEECEKEKENGGREVCCKELVYRDFISIFPSGSTSFHNSSASNFSSMDRSFIVGQSADSFFFCRQCSANNRKELTIDKSWTLKS